MELRELVTICGAATVPDIPGCNLLELIPWD